VFGRLAGYEDVNDAERLCRDPAMRWVVGGRAPMGQAASVSQMGRFETEWLTLAYNLGNFMRPLAMPKAVAPWSLTSLRQKLIKTGAKVVSHGRYVTFQMAEVAVPRQDVPGDPVAHCPVAGDARTSVRGPGIKCDGQRRLSCALMTANQRRGR
jgi:Transposase DDE domain group 1